MEFKPIAQCSSGQTFEAMNTDSTPRPTGESDAAAPVLENFARQLVDSEALSSAVSNTQISNLAVSDPQKPVDVVCEVSDTETSALDEDQSDAYSSESEMSDSQSWLNCSSDSEASVGLPNGRTPTRNSIASSGNSKPTEATPAINSATRDDGKKERREEIVRNIREDDPILKPTWLPPEFQVTGYRPYKNSRQRIVKCNICGREFSATGKSSIGHHCRARVHRKAADLARTSHNRWQSTKQLAAVGQNPIPNVPEWLPLDEFSIIGEIGESRHCVVKCKLCFLEFAVADASQIRKHQLDHLEAPIAELFPKWIPLELFRICGFQMSGYNRIFRVECQICGSKLLAFHRQTLKGHLASKRCFAAKGAHPPTQSSPAEATTLPSQPSILDGSESPNETLIENRMNDENQENEDSPVQIKLEVVDSGEILDHHSAELSHSNEENQSELPASEPQSLPNIKEEHPEAQSPEQSSSDSSESAFIRMYFSQLSGNRLQCLLCKAVVQIREAESHLQAEHSAQYEAVCSVLANSNENRPNNSREESQNPAGRANSGNTIPTDSRESTMENRKRPNPQPIEAPKSPKTRKPFNGLSNSPFVVTQPNPINQSGSTAAPKSPQFSSLSTPFATPSPSHRSPAPAINQSAGRSLNASARRIEFIDWSRTPNPPKAFRR